MDIGVLEWLNEHAQTAFPLSNFVGKNDFILDANFVQFDGFIPVLLSCTVNPDQLVISIQFDLEKVDTLINIGDANPYYTATIYGASNRYLGCVTFGPGTNDLFSNEVGSVLIWNTPFTATTVTSVNSKAGVYSIDNVFGDIVIMTGATPIEQLIFFDVAGSDITWNAVGLPDIPTDSFVALKTLNGVPPTHNAVTIDGSELIRITPGNESLTFSLSTQADTVIPSKAFE